MIGTIRRECLDWLIPCHERHLRGILREERTVMLTPLACAIDRRLLLHWTQVLVQPGKHFAQDLVSRQSKVAGVKNHVPFIFGR